MRSLGARRSSRPPAGSSAGSESIACGCRTSPPRPGVSTALVHYYCTTRADLLDPGVSLRRRARRPDRAAASVPASRPASGSSGCWSSTSTTSQIFTRVGYCGGRCGITRCLIRSCGRRWRSRTRGWVDGLAEIVRLGQADGSIPASVDGETAAWRLTAFVEGLGPLMLLGMLGRERWRELIKGAVALELGQAT